MKKSKKKLINQFFGNYGGQFVAPQLKPRLDELAQAFEESMNDEAFLRELELELKHFVGRPTPLLYAKNASEELGGARIFLKLECLANTGAHKINNAIGQALLARKMGKKKIIAETGAGQHGLAVACACARFGLECCIFMGEHDIKRQRPNVQGIEMFGARIIPVKSGAGTLSDAVDAAFAAFAEADDDTYFLIGSALGPSPYPDIVREFQSVIGKETKKQFYGECGELPDMLLACVGGGSNAIGFFSEFIDDKKVRLIGVEAGGKGDAPGEYAARMNGVGEEGVFHGYKSKFLYDQASQALNATHSVCAGLDYAGIGPQLAQLGESGRIEFMKASDSEALEAFRFFARTEGIMPALESSHALYGAIQCAKKMKTNYSIVANVSGRGDKDIFITAPAVDRNGAWRDFLKEEIKRGA